MKFKIGDKVKIRGIFGYIGGVISSPSEKAMKYDFGQVYNVYNRLDDFEGIVYDVAEFGELYIIRDIATDQLHLINNDYNEISGREENE